MELADVCPGARPRGVPSGAQCGNRVVRNAIFGADFVRQPLMVRAGRSRCRPDVHVEIQRAGRMTCGTAGMVKLPPGELAHQHDLAVA